MTQSFQFCPPTIKIHWKSVGWEIYRRHCELLWLRHLQATSAGLVSRYELAISCLCNQECERWHLTMSILLLQRRQFLLQDVSVVSCTLLSPGRSAISRLHTGGEVGLGKLTAANWGQSAEIFAVNKVAQMIFSHEGRKEVTSSSQSPVSSAHSCQAHRESSLLSNRQNHDAQSGL